ncbi:salicylaldehyde dehydrogenase [Didymella exigua CBS 183.55]|uniref:Salicylaldehyde dehydrogenase n=1 Tax=Didymella exigua CBS 183.55 TaxID=1150837 RepID=A0A6A5RKT9_9PLEO|nr:salicylaldehyde dehydrogenase [Didymella exigua CBS 183.55]KAF1926996.1 salicylaldehyde dehydrogenase [Didymella exigua CBS 183.55]
MAFLTHYKAEDGLSIVPNHINGSPQPFDPATASLFPVIKAVSETKIHHAVSATSSIAISACDAAATALQSWRNTTPSHRRALLHKAANVIESKAQEIMQAQVDETSCPKEFAAINVKGSVAHMREIAAATSELRGTVPQRGTGPDGEEVEELTIVVREPVGVVLVIPPWNGAVVLPLRAVSQVLAAGCTVQAGVPSGVINVIQVRREGAADVTEAIIAHKAVRKIDFIGSAAVGKRIGQVCAKHLKPILMELGGKGPAIVLEDADLQKAAFLCAMGAIINHGQLCFSTERIIVHKANYEKFIQLLKMSFAKFPAAGNAVSKQSAQHAYDVLIDAQDNGAAYLVGGPEFITPTSLRPTVVTKVSRNARLRDEETFGPSVSVYVAEDDDDAVAIANDSAYGLSAAVHSGSWEHAYKIERQLEYGQVHVNNMTTGDSPGAPIRGVKGSGWGQSNSIWGIHEFSVEKTLVSPPFRS